jgi:hypothetical protein
MAFAQSTPDKFAHALSPSPNLDGEHLNNLDTVVYEDFDTRKNRSRGEV